MAQQVITEDAHLLLNDAIEMAKDYDGIEPRDVILAQLASDIKTLRSTIDDAQAEHDAVMQGLEQQLAGYSGADAQA